jgi:hypothetical protein
MNESHDIRDRIEQVRERIAEAARRVGRHPDEVTLVAVTKTVDPKQILQAINGGIKHLGENRVQEAESKFGETPGLRESATWHFIGHLQTNKVRRAVSLFDVIQSVDRPDLAERIDRIAGEAGKTVLIYLQVDIGLEPTKFGVPPDGLIALAEKVAACRHLRLEGLMAIPPYFEEPEHVRPYFSRLRRLLEDLNDRKIFDRVLTGLSMGMSHDFEIAVEEGATVVRVGTAIFGLRPE